MSSKASVIYSQFEAAFDFPGPIMNLIRTANTEIYEHSLSPSAHSAFYKYETKYRLQLNVVLKGVVMGKEDKRLARIALKAFFIMHALRDLQEANDSLLYSETTFLENYPQFAGVSEIPLLTKFRNIIAVSLTLMEADNNKSKHLTIATRLSEGKRAKYITGSGQTEATTRRVTIFDKESRIASACSALLGPSKAALKLQEPAEKPTPPAPIHVPTPVPMPAPVPVKQETMYYRVEQRQERPTSIIKAVAEGLWAEQHEKRAVQEHPPVDSAFSALLQAIESAPMPPMKKQKLFCDDV